MSLGRKCWGVPEGPSPTMSGSRLGLLPSAWEGAVMGAGGGLEREQGALKRSGSVLVGWGGGSRGDPGETGAGQASRVGQGSSQGLGARGGVGRGHDPG